MPSTETVSLNVGGVKHEVSRSLIDLYPETMLARLISDRWHKSKPNEAIFIDRDGELFRYVLAYMRDKKAYLPLSVSKGSVTQEFAYFGFDITGIPPDAIICNHANFEAATSMAECQKAYDAEIKMLDQAAKDIAKRPAKNQSPISSNQVSAKLSMQHKLSFTQNKPS